MMNSVAFEQTRRSTRGVTWVDTLENLIMIRDPACAAVILQRPPHSGLYSWLAGLPPHQLPNAREILHPAEVRSTLIKICTRSGTPDCTEREILIESITALTDTFTAVMRAPWLRLRLDVVTGDGCRKFHIDAVTARLVCTYRGTGTQYGIVGDKTDPAEIETLPVGDPILLRGSLWPENPLSGLKHRSPPIADTGETRLLLVIDPIFDPEDAA